MPSVCSCCAPAPLRVDLRVRPCVTLVALVRAGSAIRNNPGFVELRKIDAARDIASTMARSANHVFLSADTLLLNVMSQQKQDAATVYVRCCKGPGCCVPVCARAGGGGTCVNGWCLGGGERRLCCSTPVVVRVAHAHVGDDWG